MKEDPLLTAFAIPVTRSSRLRVTFWNPSTDTTQTVLVNWRQLTPEGDIITSSDSVLVAAGANGTVSTFPLTDGLLLAVTVTTFGTSLEDGDLFAAIAVQQGTANVAANVLPLVTGYVTAFGALNYPLSEPRGANVTPGANILVGLNDPGLGNEINFSFGTNFETVLDSLTFNLANGHAVTADTPVVIIGDVAGEIVRVSTAQTTAAATSRVYTMIRDPLPLVVPTGRGFIDNPELGWIRGLTITTVTTNFDPNDEYNGVLARVRRRVAI